MSEESAKAGELRFADLSELALEINRRILAGKAITVNSLYGTEFPIAATVEDGRLVAFFRRYDGSIEGVDIHDAAAEEWGVREVISIC